MSALEQDPGEETARGDAVHWLVRIAERAGLGEAERPSISPGVKAQGAWSDVTRAYALSDADLSKLVAEYFRLNVADFDKAEHNAALLIPETMARKHHIFPLLENDRNFVVATCDPTDVEAERALGFSTGRTPPFEVERVLGQQLDGETKEDESRPPRILLVDDDEDARLLMRHLLERDGYEVRESGDGHKALDLLQEDQAFNLVILDLALPGLDGRAVLQQLRGSLDTAALPVLIRTGTGSDQIEAELLEAGADDYVEKSVDADRFMARVHAVLRRAL
jgi:CheY-like chemotaxis protein